MAKKKTPVNDTRDTNVGSMRNKPQTSLRFNSANLTAKDSALELADKFNPPYTLGKPTNKRTVKALDSCFQPVRTMIGHSLENLSTEGVPVFPGYTTLIGLSQNSIIRAGVEMRAKEMTRKWGELVSTAETNERIDALNKAMEKYKVKDLFYKIAEQCGFLGGCLLFIDTGEDVKELVNPLPHAGPILRDKLKRLTIVDPWVVYPGEYNSTNPLATDYYKPKIWYVQGIPVSKTRFIYFAENEIPDMIKPAYNFFGISLTQRVLDAVSHYTRNRESASKLLEKVSLVVLKTNMDDILSGSSDLDLKRRLKYFADNWNFNGVAAIDYEHEDLSIFNNTLSGIVDIVRQSMEYVAAMFNEPATKLWGISPAGMNATGESDMRNHYDNIASLQEQMFRRGIDELLDILQLDMFGDVDTEIHFKFAPLSDEESRTKAETNKIKAETADIYYNMGAVGPQEIRDALIKDPNSGYNDLPEYGPDVGMPPVQATGAPPMPEQGEAESEATQNEEPDITARV